MKRDDIVSQMEAMHNLTISEARAFTAAEQTQWDGLIAQVRQFDQMAEVAIAPTSPSNPTRPVGAPALHLTQRASHAGLLRGAIALACGERGIDTGLAAEFDREVRRRNPGRSFEAVAMSLKSLLVTKAEVGALSGGLAEATTGTQFMDSLFFRTSDALFGPRLAQQLGVNTVLAGEEKVSITKLIGTVTPTWIARDSAVPQSDATFDADMIEPKSVGTYVTLKRSALLYGNHPSVEPLMMQDLRNAILTELDRAVLFGEGGLAPTGVASLATAGHALDSLASAYVIRNSLFAYGRTTDATGAKWLIPDLVEAKFATSVGFSGSTAPALVVGGQIAGIDYVLNPVSGAGSPSPSMDYLFGQWAWSHLFLWDSASVAADPFGDSFLAGAMKLRILADANVYVRDPNRFYTGAASALSA
ncbi:phage major capsid family protein [Rhizobacter fulvus]